MVCGGWLLVAAGWGVRGQNAAAGDGEQRGEQGEAGDQPAGDPEGGDRTEAADRRGGCGKQAEQAGDDGAAGGEDRGAGVTDRRGQGLPVIGGGVELFAVASDEQQGVVGGGAEDQHVQDAGGQGRDGQRTGAGQRGDDRLRDQQAGADGQHRQQPQHRAAVDDQQHDDDRGRRGQQPPVDAGGRGVGVGGVPGGAGDRDAQVTVRRSRPAAGYVGGSPGGGRNRAGGRDAAQLRHRDVEHRVFAGQRDGEQRPCGRRTAGPGWAARPQSPR